MVKQDACFAVSAKDGSMKPEEFAGDGLWLGDTRILSRFRLLVDGLEPELVSHQVVGGCATFELRAGALDARRERFVDGGLRERITISNPGSTAVTAVAEIDVAADFAAMLVVRGIVRQLPSAPAVSTIPTPDGVRFASERAEADSSRVMATPPGLRQELRLAPGETFAWVIEVGPGPAPARIQFDAGIKEVRSTYAHWASDCMSVRTDNPTLNEVLDQALADIRMLCNRYDTGIFPTGGLPWYAVPFGRDPLITSILLLHVNPELARGVLRYLAARQGRGFDEDSEEQPGKILHEVRTGEVVDRGLWPHILYGTIDATALFLCALTETENWTSDHALIDELWPAAEAALQWCLDYGDAEADGYIEYRGARARNQGWKDSDDSLTNPDGSDALRPAALCEVQAYLYRGLVGMSRRRPALRERAEELKRRFNRDFWMPDLGFVAQALDANKDQVRAITSNPGHCLWMRILESPRAAQVVKRLVSPELFSGWGIRTLSDQAINYDPCSYHNGSVWPFDTALSIAGMRQYGFAEEAERVATALMEAVIELPLRRPPELFCGNPREPGGPPKEYWNTCTPQLWSAASMYTVVSSILGLEADPQRKRLRVAPIKTRLWNRIEVTGLHFAGERIDFSVEGTAVKVGSVPAGISVDLGA
ncbi:MAG TPA: glycogen debranching N-terminal domain-containing protein [Candidatus Dormibacteraeota bacterium]